MHRGPKSSAGNYATANVDADELIALADEKGAFSGRRWECWMQGGIFALTGKASDAVHMITSGITA